MELFHSGSFWMEFLSKAARCNTRLDGLRFDWQRDSICWVGLQGRDALPAGLMHGSSQRDSHLLNPHLWIIDTTHLKLSLYFPGRASQIFQCEQSRVHKQGRKMWCWRVCNWKHAKSANSCIFFLMSIARTESWIVGLDMSDFILGVYCWKQGATYQKLSSNSWYFPLCFRVNLNICWRAFSACVYVCLHMKASGEAHLSTRQHIKAFSRWSERPPALGLYRFEPCMLGDS